MTIQEDAGNILYFIYEQYTNDKSVNAQLILDTTKWDGKRIDRAIKYLKDINAINIVLMLGNLNGVQNFIFRGLTPIGIHIVENKPEFRKNFGFEINLGVFKYSWGSSER